MRKMKLLSLMMSIFCLTIMMLWTTSANAQCPNFLGDNGPTAVAGGSDGCFDINLDVILGYDDGTIVPFADHFVDISGTGTYLGSGDDVAFTATLGFTFPFTLVTSGYTNDWTTIRVATNGYLSNDLSDGGPDLSNDCPIPSGPSTGGGDRLYLVHDDLVVNTAIRYQFFAAGASGHPGHPTLGTSIDCGIIMWDNVRHFGNSTTWDMEVILYANGDHLNLVQASEPENGAGSTIGMQDVSASFAETFGCNTSGMISGDIGIMYTASGPYEVVWTGPDGVSLAPSQNLSECFTFTHTDPDPCVIQDQTVSYMVTCTNDGSTIATGTFNVAVSGVPGEPLLIDPIAIPDAITICEDKAYPVELFGQITGGFQFERALVYSTFDDCMKEIDMATGVVGPCIPSTQVGTDFVGGGEMFDADGNGVPELYLIDNFGNLFSYDLMTDEIVNLGSLGVLDLTSIAYDPVTATMYGITFGGCSATAGFYEIDVVNVTATSLATISGIGGGAIAMAPDMSGGMIMIDLCDDQIYSIDLATYTATSLCGLPFSPNFGQDMTYNPVTGLIDYFAFNGSAFAAQYYTMDPANPCTLTLVQDYGFNQYTASAHVSIPPDITFSWEPADPALISDPYAEDPIAWPTYTNNVYTLTATDNNTGCTVTQSVTITVEGIEVIYQNIDNVLEGDGGDNPYGYNTHTIEIIGAVEPLTYTWDTDGYVRHSISDEGIIEIIYTDDATWCVTIVDANGCNASRESEALIFCNEAYYAGPAEILDIVDYVITASTFGQDNGAIDITVVGTAPFTYEWSGPNGYTATNEDIFGLAPGWYSVTVTDSYVDLEGNPAPQSTVGWYWVPRIDDGGPGIRGKMEAGSLTAAPNPFNDLLNINFSTTNDTPATIELYNINGQKVSTVYNGTVNANTTQSVEVNTQELASGIYFLHLITNEGLVQVYKIDKINR